VWRALRLAAIISMALVSIAALTACGGSSSAQPTPALTPDAMATIWAEKGVTPPPTPPMIPGSRVDAMQVVAPGVGWAHTSERLAWTSDGGTTWRDITPGGADPRKEYPFFLDSLHGWTSKVEGPTTGYAPAKVTIYKTSDSGRTWEIIGSFPGPELTTETLPMFGGTLQFVDKEHGWFAGVYVTGMLHSARLYRTSDGGITWEEVLHPREAYQYDLRFTDSHIGWFAAEAPQPLFVTQDGGTSWEPLALPIPPGCTLASGGAGAAAPVFDDSQHGTVVVRGDCQDNNEGVSWFFNTADGGTSWALVRTIDRPIRASIVSSTTWLYAADERLDDQLFSTKDAGVHWQTITPDWSKLLGTSDDPVRPNVYLQYPAFVTPNDGWAFLSANDGPQHLISTSDGGHTWKLLQP
jgi:hypothetical protein